MSRYSSPVGQKQPPTVPLRWLAGWLAAMLVIACLCAWGALCYTFWQGSWQLLYHPSAAVLRTPAGKGLPYDSVSFGSVATGQPMLRGWWLAAPAGADAARTVLYFHGAMGNMGDSVDMLESLHSAGVNVFTLDYRGYGQSQFAHPSEARWREDAEAALSYLTGTRHVSPQSIVVAGRDLGANLALDIAAGHSEIAGVVAIAPLPSPTALVLRDPRARLVPARALLADRWNLRSAAEQVRVPVLWVEWTVEPGVLALPDRPAAFLDIPSPRNFVWLIPTRNPDATFSKAISAWLGDLGHQGRDLPACMAGGDTAC